jgi:DNA integrity scanning protein DisA with diadenylate cyclase activity
MVFPAFYSSGAEAIRITQEGNRMSEANTPQKTTRSNAELVRLIIQVAEATQPAAIICVTETGALAQRLYDLLNRFRIIAATTNRDTYEALIQTDLEAIRLPLHAADKYNQVRHAISVALRSTTVSIGDLVACTIGRNVYPREGDLVVLTEVEPSLETIAVSDLLKLTDGIRPTVLEAAVIIAGKIGRAARRGKRIGALFTLGDSVKVLKDSRQLVPNPFYGHDDATRRLTNPDIYDALVELAKLDGAFVVRGDGFIQTAGAFLTAPQGEMDIPIGLGARHATAAAVTKRTMATAVVVSATDGNVRVFSEGKMVLQMDPDVAHGPIAIDE